MRKRTYLGIFASMLLAVTATADARQLLVDENEMKTTRYEVFIAEHNAIVNGKTTTLKSIFKIDLETGTVWRYRQGVDSKGKPFEEFLHKTSN